MKLYAIRDEAFSKKEDIGYIFYHEKSKRFYIELMENVDEWHAPFMLAHFVRKGIYSIDSAWSSKWVESRIVPRDRQNLGMILKANRLKEYDVHKLLVISDGRCAQDECYIVRTYEDKLPDEIKRRRLKKVKNVAPLDNFRILVFFGDGTARLIDAKQMMKDEVNLIRIVQSVDVFNIVSVIPFGNGIQWGDNIEIPAETLYTQGIRLPLTADDFVRLMTGEMVTTSGAAKMFGCSRQYINQLIDKDKLHPIVLDEKNRLYFRSELSNL